MRYAITLIPLLCLALLSGCASTRTTDAEPQASAAPPDPRGVVMFDGATGESLTWSQLVERAAGAQAVLIGENHGHPLGLASAAALFDDLLAGPARSTAALSLEFFERDEQSRVDDYLAGLSDEKTFRSRTGRTPGNFPAAHAQMFEAAKAAGRPVIASNAPRPYVRLARTKGYDALRALTPEQQRLVRIPDALPTGRYRDEFFKVMAQMPAMTHGQQPGVTLTEEEKNKRLEDLLRSQTLWDWTMAESVARGVAAGAAPVVQVVGRFHVDIDGGLPQALRAISPGVRTLTVSMVDAESPGALADADRGRADVVVYVGPARPEPSASPVATLRR